MAPRSMRSPGLSLGVHVVDQINHSVAVSELVVVPGDEFDEGPRQLDPGLSVEDRGSLVPEEVGGDNHVLGVAENS